MNVYKIRLNCRLKLKLCVTFNVFWDLKFDFVFVFFFLRYLNLNLYFFISKSFYSMYINSLDLHNVIYDEF